jgi:hypothetical protein
MAKKRGKKRSSDASNPKAKRLKQADSAPAAPSSPAAAPSSPLRPIPYSKDQLRPTDDFEPMNRLHFERSIASLPDTPFHLFQLFYPLEFVEKWVKYTNDRPFWIIKVGKQAHHAEGPSYQYSRQNAWKPTTTFEIYVFLGILIYMSVHREPRIADYWSTSSSNPTHIIPRFISRDRFLLLYQRFSTWNTITEVSIFEKVDLWSTHIQDISM